MDVQHLRMERVTFVQQRLTQIATWLIGQFAINVANMTRTVSFIFHTSIFIIIFYINLLQQIASWAICKAEGQGKAYGSGDGTAQDCIFPFKYKGKTYTACVTPSDGQKPYCATKVDSNGNLVEGKWARCNKYCKTDKGEMLFYVYLSHISYIYT